MCGNCPQSTTLPPKDEPRDLPAPLLAWLIRASFGFPAVIVLALLARHLGLGS